MIKGLRFTVFLIQIITFSIIQVLVKMEMMSTFFTKQVMHIPRVKGSAARLKVNIIQASNIFAGTRQVKPKL